MKIYKVNSFEQSEIMGGDGLLRKHCRASYRAFIVPAHFL